MSSQAKVGLSMSSGSGGVEVQDIKKLMRINTLPAKTFKNLIPADDRVRKEVPKPIGERLSASLMFDWEGKPNLDLMRNHFLREGRLEIEAATKLIKQVLYLF